MEKIEERKAWVDIFEELETLFNLDRKELNSSKYRELFVLIEKWAYADRMRRATLSNPEEFKGCLWDE